MVPCWRFEQVTEVQFAEADGIEAWCTQRQAARVKRPEAMKEATAWLDAKSEDTNRPRRELLSGPENRKAGPVQSNVSYRKAVQEQGDTWWDSVPIPWRCKPSRCIEGSGPRRGDGLWSGP